jgi:phage-related protein
VKERKNPIFGEKSVVILYLNRYIWVIMGKAEPILKVLFYKTESGREPVREWLKAFRSQDMKEIGQDIKTAQFGWPLGMPLIRKLEKDLWEVRSNIKDGIARTIFTIEGAEMILLHGFVKKSQATPQAELDLARERKRKYHGQ